MRDQELLVPDIAASKTSLIFDKNINWDTLILVRLIPGQYDQQYSILQCLVNSKLKRARLLDEPDLVLILPKHFIGHKKSKEHYHPFFIHVSCICKCLSIWCICTTTRIDIAAHIIVQSFGMDIMYLPTLYSACQCIIMYICCTSLKLLPALKLLQVGCLQYSRLKRYLAFEPSYQLLVLANNC